MVFDEVALNQYYATCSAADRLTINTVLKSFGITTSLGEGGLALNSVFEGVLSIDGLEGGV